MMIKIFILTCICVNILYAQGTLSDAASLAYRAYRARDYRTAIDLFEREISESPILKIEYFETLASCYLAMRDYTNMLITARRGILVNQFSGRLYYQKGYALYRLGSTNEAILAMEHSLTLAPTSAYNNNFLGLLYLYTADYTNAELYFLKATVYSPTNVVYIVNLGAAYERQKNYRDALVQYERAARFNPNYRGLQNSILRAKRVLGGREVSNPDISTAELDSSDDSAANEEAIQSDIKP